MQNKIFGRFVSAKELIVKSKMSKYFIGNLKIIFLKLSVVSRSENVGSDQKIHVKYDQLSHQYKLYENKYKKLQYMKLNTAIKLYVR